MYNSNQSQNFPTIDLGGYILRKITLDDAEDFLEYYSDPEVNKYIISSIPSNIEESKSELQYWINVFNYSDGIYFAIVKKDNNRLIGTIGISSANRRHNRIEASYDLAKEYWGQGIVTKALKAVIKYGFEKLQFNRIEAYVMSDNIGSYRVLQKCGFMFEGVLRQHRFHNGKYIDIGSYSIIYKDFLPILSNIPSNS